MPETFWQDLPGILTITFMFGGGILYAIVNTLASNWRQARVAEQNAVLKRAMLDKGFTAAEIERVIHAGVGSDDKIDATASKK
ncbi:hypothetical protein BH11PLA2_BH11PLA2_15000 [soil metagenome]